MKNASAAGDYLERTASCFRGRQTLLLNQYGVSASLQEIAGTPIESHYHDVRRVLVCMYLLNLWNAILQRMSGSRVSRRRMVVPPARSVYGGVAR
jgi:hypothetical protein